MIIPNSIVIVALLYYITTSNELTYDVNIIQLMEYYYIYYKPHLNR